MASRAMEGSPEVAMAGDDAAPRLRYFVDPVSFLTHCVGAVAAIGGLVYLVTDPRAIGARLVTNAIYGATLVGMLSASSIYHFFDPGPRGKRWLRRMDHTAIFLLIAGTYLPPLVHALDGAWRVSMIAVVGGLALFGVAFKLFWINCPRWLSAGIYLALGWIVVIPAAKIFPVMPGWSTFWLVVGGLFYTVGAIIYARKWPNPYPGRFGFHEIWHLFVLGGAGSHFIFVTTFLDQSYAPF